MQKQLNMHDYLGTIGLTEIIDTTGFDTLTPEHVFIRKEASLVLPDGSRAPFANPEYLEFRNSADGRERLNNCNIKAELISAILLVWGDTPIVQDPD